MERAKERLSDPSCFGRYVWSSACYKWGISSSTYNSHQSHTCILLHLCSSWSQNILSKRMKSIESASLIHQYIARLSLATLRPQLWLLLSLLGNAVPGGRAPTGVFGTNVNVMFPSRTVLSGRPVSIAAIAGRALGAGTVAAGTCS